MITTILRASAPTAALTSAPKGMAARTLVSLTLSVASISIAVPPAKSTPKLRPRVVRKKAEAASIATEKMIPAMRRFMNLRLVCSGQNFISMFASLCP